MKSRIVLAALCLASVPLLGACRATPLHSPEPVQLTQAEPEMRDIILKAMQRRSPGWRVQDEDRAQRKIRARIHNRAHIATVDIFYTDTEVRIQHVDSENLKEATSSSGEKTIHRAYNTWVTNLRNDIEDELAVTRMNRTLGQG